MTAKEIDERICMALSLLEKHQDTECGFETYKINPNSEHGMSWIRELKNAFLPANVLLPLTLIKDETAERILRKELDWLKGNVNSIGLWHYFNDKMALFFIPYETDTNALFSYVNSYIGKKALNKKFFYHYITESGYFNLWFLPKLKFLFSHPWFYMEVKRNWIKAKSFPAFKHNVVVATDAEFSVSSNVLLYVGENENTQRVVEKLLQEVHDPAPINLVYYPKQTIALYLFARSYYYGNIKSFDCAKEVFERKLVASIETDTQGDNKHLHILAANALLFYNSSHPKLQNCIDNCWDMFSEIEKPFAFYCSNSATDYNFEKKVHNAYFGGPALTLSSYLEFLNLLRFRKTGSHYGEVST